MSIIHVRQIETKLRSLFNELIDMSDYPKQQNQDSAFLSRALAAFSILINAGTTPEQAASSVTDGFDDEGIDAVYFDSGEKIIFVVQSKWQNQGTGSINQGDALKFIHGVKALIQGDFSTFNSKFQAKYQEIYDALCQTNTRICLMIVYTGQAQLSPKIQKIFEDFVQEYNDTSEVVKFKVINQVELHQTIANGALGAAIDFEIGLKNWGQIRDPYSAYYGMVSATEVADWWNKYYPKIFMPNIRSFLGETEINQSIVETLVSEPEKFWYFNNGITALCSKIAKKTFGGTSHDIGFFECFDVSIVNGAQTVGAIATANTKSPDQVAKAFVSIRFISLESCPEDFAIRVTRGTNTQNRIDSRDFVSLDTENQERIRTELQLEGVEYVYKAGYTVRDSISGFDFSEAIVAVACSHSNITYAVQAKSKVSLLYEDIKKEPYKALFNPSISSIKIWNLVQIHRAIEAQLKAEEKKRKGREGLIAVHGNRFLARQVFLRLNLGNNNLDDPQTSIEEIIKNIPEIIIDVIDATAITINEKYPDSYPANLFKTLHKCQEVENAIQILLKRSV